MKLNSKYEPQSIESKWQKVWLESKIYEPNLDTSAKQYYNLHMFPYPSAEGLHVGNVYAFTGADIHGRFKRMQGYDVFQPFGLDGFGIHSENYALKVGVHPMDQAEKSEKRFYDQVKMLGSGYDWSAALETYKEDYYKWTQWVFIQLFKAGLAYRKNVPVNFCPSCKTVLADEQVIDGKCERCSSAVEKRDLDQWMFRITSYADQLLEGLDRINWTEKVKIAQRNWIGKSEGAEIEFRIQNSEFRIKVFTTRPDTLYGVTFLVISPEHEVVNEILKHPSHDGQDDKIKDGVINYIAAAATKSDADRVEDKVKTGVFSGAFALNPINNQQIPIWIADYVLSSYGTGAIMAVPAHDQRDFEFAQEYDLPVTHVVMPSIVDDVNPPIKGKENTSRKTVIAVVHNPIDDTYLCLKWSEQEWTTFITGGVEEGEDAVDSATREVLEETGYSDIEFVRTLGGPTEAFFHAAHKGVNRRTQSQIILFNLKSNNRIEVADDEKARHEAVWLKEEEVMSAKLRHSEFSLIMERIKTGIDAYVGDGILINSGDWNGLTVAEAKKKAIEDLQAKKIGEEKTTYHLRDWLISRQRYWGPPIPMIFCQSCADKGESWFTGEDAKNKKASAHSSLSINPSSESAGWYPAEDLPVVLPRIDDYKPIGDDVKMVDGKAVTSPLGNHPEFYKTTCPHCGAEARRETDVSDTFLDSSWYFYRYFSAGDSEHAWSVSRDDKWMPVSIYTGGAEHSVLHLLYSRFVTKAFKDAGLISDYDEPFPRFFAHGLIIKDGAKMSKSKGNVIVPDAYIKKFGADTLRTYLMFLGPFDAGGDFRDSGIEGMHRFMKRVWTMMSGQIIPGTVEDTSAISFMHKTIKGVTEDIEAFRYNTAIAKIMTYYNFLVKQQGIHSDEAEVFLKLLAPFAPHMTEELFQNSELRTQNIGVSIHVGGWPEYDQNAIQAGDIVIAVQINGKLRSTFEISDMSLSQDEVEKLARLDESVSKHLEGKDVKKIIYVPGKILNYVV